MWSKNHNVGAGIKWQYGVNTKSITAGAGSDNAEHVVTVLDRLDATSQGLAQSATLCFLMTTTLAAAATIKTPIFIDDSVDNSNWSGYVTLSASETLATGLTTTEADVYAYDVDLAPYHRYVRFKIKPDLSASGTDVADIHVGVITGGYTKTPVV